MMTRAIFALLFACAAASAHAQALTVFAAASLKNALDEVASAYVAANGAARPAIAFAASSALARQIANGAPADVFISADLDWMDFLEGKGLLVPGTRRKLLGNRIVLIAPADRPVRLEPLPGFAIGKALGDGRLALADPAHVPAGKYARAALENLGVWNEVAERIAPAQNVRAALALVARGEAPLGIVYRTDALAEPKVLVAGVFPANSHPPIVYPAAAVKGAREGAGRFLEFLSGARARRIFGKYGFAVD